MRLIQRRDLYMVAVIGVIEGVRLGSPRLLRPGAARALGGLAYRVSRQKRRRIERQLTYTFGESLGASRQRTIVQQSFVEFWDEMLCWSETALPRSVDAQAQLCGVEHLQAALARGRGAILWESNGFGKRLLSKQILHAHGFDLVQVHALGHVGGIGADPAKASRLQRHFVNPYFDTRLRRFVRHIIYLPGAETLTFTRELLQCLHQNQIICIPIEGHLGQKKITLPFLGQVRGFATGTVNLARMSGAPLLPLFCLPLPEGGYLLEIGKAIQIGDESPREEHLRAALVQMVNELDARVRAHPEWYRHWNFLTDDEND